jgi:dTDP-glucose pyrophosphorylase
MKMKAVILAAGKGERLRPLTDTKPKHILPVGGAPLLEWPLRGLVEVGISEVLIVTHYMEDQIKAHLGDGSSLGVSISYARQDEMKGTADAFAVGEAFVGDDEFKGEALSNLANTGIYVFTPEIFDRIRDTGLSSRGEYEVTDSIGSLIESGAKVKCEDQVWSVHRRAGIYRPG